MSVNSNQMNRGMATTARGAVAVAAGLACGVMTAHLAATWGTVRAQAAGPSAATAASAPKPTVVTKWRTKHVASDPVIVYRKHYVVDGQGSSAPTTGGWTSGTTSASTGSGGLGAANPPAPRPAARPAPVAPRPAPQPAPPPATSTSS